MLMSSKPFTFFVNIQLQNFPLQHFLHVRHFILKQEPTGFAKKHPCTNMVAIS